MQNLTTLQEYVDGANTGLIEIMRNSGDESIASQAEQVAPLHADLKQEIQKQLAMLSNLTNTTISPINKSLISLLVDNKDFTGLVSKFEQRAGTKDFGRSLSYLMSGISDVSQAALMVDKALKKIGVSVADYRMSDNMKKLRKTIYDKLSSISKNQKGGLTAKKLQEFMAAADILYKNDLAHADIAALLAKKKNSAAEATNGGYSGGGYSDDSFADMVSDGMSSVDDSVYQGRKYSKRKAIQSQLKNSTKFRKTLFADLDSQLKSHFEIIIDAVNRIGRKLGSDIPNSAEVESFIKNMVYLSESTPDRKDLHEALSGYRKDATSRYVKSEFLDRLYAVRTVSKQCANGHGGQLFIGVADAVGKLIELINMFNDDFSKAITDVHVSITPQRAKGGGLSGCCGGGSESDENSDSGEYNDSSINVDSEEEYEGGMFNESDLNGIGGGGKRNRKKGKKGKQGRSKSRGNNISKTAHKQDFADELNLDEEHDAQPTDTELNVNSIESVVEGIEGGMKTHGGGRFKYFVTLAKAIRELDYYHKISFIKNNLRMVAPENKALHADYINILGEECGLLIDKINKEYNSELKTINTYTNESADKKKGYKFLLKYTQMAKIEMLEAAQAIDLYMQQFTTNIEMSPDDIKDFANILEQIEVVAKWFTNKSGDHMAEAFHNASNPDVKNKMDLKGDHYYDWVSKKPADVKSPFEEPQIMDFEQSKDFVQSIERSIKGMRALENIINTFTNVSNKAAKHGGSEVSKINTFMSPGLIFKALMKYMVASSISVGFTESKDGLDPTTETKYTYDNDEKDPYAKEETIKPTDGNKEYVYGEDSDFEPEEETSEEGKNKINARRLEVAVLDDADLINVPANVPRGRSSMLSQEQITAKVQAARVLSDQQAAARAAVVEKPDDDTAIESDGESIGGGGGKPEKYINKAGVSLRPSHRTIKLEKDKYRTYHELLVVPNTIPLDDVFEMCIKSIVSKVFVVVGTYSLFNRPSKNYKDSNSLANRPLRQIIGGSSKPKINVDAVELYVRLPLLAEWYREIFAFKAKGASVPDSILVSMVPAIDGVWSDFVKVIFVDAEGINDGSYTSNYADDIIRSINDIYDNFSKSYQGKDLVRDIMMSFVVEVNRRYGFVKQKEIDAYFTEKYNYMNGSESYDDQERVDYDITGADDVYGRGQAPSDKFRSVYNEKEKSAVKLSKLHEEVRKFRSKVETALILSSTATSLEINSIKDLKNITLTDLIRETRHKVRTSKKGGGTHGNGDSSYEIIRSIIHGIDKFADVDNSQYLILHEEVVTPLTALYYIYRLMNSYNRFMQSINVGENGKNKGKEIFNYIDASLKKESYKYKSDQNHYLAMTVSEINDMLPTDSTKNNDLMKKVINRLFNVGCDLNNLTEIYFSGDGDNRYPALNFSKLQDTCEVLLHHVKTSLKKLKPHMPKDVLDIYEIPQDSNGEHRVASLAYLEEHLFDRLFNNRYGLGLSDSNTALKNIWLHMITTARLGNYTHNKAMSELIYWLDAAIPEPESVSDGNSDTKRTGRTTAVKGGSSGSDRSLVDAKKHVMRFGSFFKSGKHLSNKTEVNAWNEDYDKTKDHFDSSIVVTDTKVGVEGIYDKLTDTSYSSLGLIPMLNNLIFRYLSVFISAANEKIYLPLLSDFANGNNSGEIMEDGGIDDLGATNPTMSDIKPENARKVIFRSLARAIKNLVTQSISRSSTTSLQFAEENLADVPEYMKDMMKAYLPIFEKELNIICEKAKLLKLIMEKTKIKVGTTLTNETEVKTKLIILLETVNSTAKSLNKSVMETQVELNDVPLYFETYNDSIVDYNNRNSRLPFMPLSAVTRTLNMQDGDDSSKIKRKLHVRYDSRVGSDSFKLLYGTRLLLAKNKIEPNVDYAPGVAALWKDTTSGGYSGGDSSQHSFVSTVKLIRFLTDTFHHKSGYSDAKANQEEYLKYSKEYFVENKDQKVYNLSCQTGIGKSNNTSSPEPSFWLKYSNILDQVENDNAQSVQYRLLSCLKSNGNNMMTTSRKDMRVYNILDLNIVPINVHALQREVPLVNIMNYSYTFDHMIKNFIGVDYKTKALSEVKSWIDVNSTIDLTNEQTHFNTIHHPEDTLVKHLIHPCGYRSLKEYLDHYYRIAAGNTSLSLNRPKYISDQLWNKVLLNSLYPTQTTSTGDQWSYDNARGLSGSSDLDLNEARTHSNAAFRGGTGENRRRYLQASESKRSTDEPFDIGVDTFITNATNTSSYKQLGSDEWQLTSNDSSISKDEIKSYTELNSKQSELAAIGYLRYNTKLVRYVDWIVEIQRVMRLLMRAELSWISDPVVNSHDAINEQVTEYELNNTYDINDYN
jgi:hypothetical protein